MKPILLIRGVHQNEKSAFDLAERVFTVLQRRGAPVVLETIPREHTIWSVFDNADGLSGEEIVKRCHEARLGPYHDAEFDDIPRDQDYHKYSFHNYPVSDDGQGYGPSRSIVAEKLDRARVGKVEMTKFDEMKGDGEVAFMSPYTIGYVVEIPAFYHTDAPVRRLPVMDVAPHIGRYLYEVDCERTRQEGLMDDRMTNTIAQAILNFTPGYKDYR